MIRNFIYNLILLIFLSPKYIVPLIYGQKSSDNFDNVKPLKIINDLPLSPDVSNTNYKMEFIVSGDPIPIYRWYQKTNRDFKNISQNSQFKISNNVIEFPSSTIYTDTYFYCSSSNYFGTILSRQSIVRAFQTIKSPAIVYDSIEVANHQKAVIICKIHDDLIAKFYTFEKWETTESRTITGSKPRFSVINFTTLAQLHIRNLTSDDATNLEVRCIFRNKYDHSIVKNSSFVKPKLHDYMIRSIFWKYCNGRPVRVRQGTKVELPWCSQPQTLAVEWYRSKDETMKIAEKLRRGDKFGYTSEGDGNLLIHNVDISDEGYYFVKLVGSGIPKDYIPFHVRVIVPVGVRIYNRFLPVRAGETIVIMCEVSAYPVSNIFWLFNGNRLSDVSTEYKILTKIENNSTQLTSLRIFNVNIKNAGVYQCSANFIEDSYFDNAQDSTHVFITNMLPVLIKQDPPLSPHENYGTVTLASPNRTSAQITCIFQSSPKSRIQWYLDDNKIPLDFHVSEEVFFDPPYTVITTVKIDLNGVSFIDKWTFGGEYMAVASNGIGNSSCKTMVYIENVLHIRPSAPISVRRGETKLIKCYVISSQKPEIEWKKIINGKEERLTSHHEEELEDKRVLRLISVSKLIHQSQYKCLARVVVSTVSNYFNVIITQPPVIDIDQTLLLKLGQSPTSLFCRPVTPIDSPWYAWWVFEYKNGTTTVPEKQEYVNYGTVQDSNNFPLTDLPSFVTSNPNAIAKVWIEPPARVHDQLPVNAICKIRNHAALTTKTVKVTFLYLEFKNPLPQVIDVTVGESFQQDCEAKKIQMSTMSTWSYLKGSTSDSYVDVPLYTEDKPQRIFQYSNGTLVGKRITESDPIVFMCTITTPETADKGTHLVKIVVQVPAVIRNNMSQIDMRLGFRSNLTCVVHGDYRDLTVSWYRVNHPETSLVTTKTEMPKTKTVNVVHDIDIVTNRTAGSYYCAAHNFYNREQMKYFVQVNVVDIPTPVQNIQKIVGDRHAVISWEKPLYNGNKPILDYSVDFYFDNRKNTTVVQSTNIDLKGLRPFYLYNVSIRARNNVGFSVAQFVDIRTEEAAPDGTVMNLTCTALSSTTLLLLWKPPHSTKQNGDIIGYRVCYQKIENSNNVSYLSQLPWLSGLDTVFNKEIVGKDSRKVSVSCRSHINQTNFTLPDLQKYTQYAFRIIAYNKKGSGPAAYVWNRTREDFPDKPPTRVECTTSSSSMKISWNPPPQESINGVIKVYEIIYLTPDRLGRDLVKMVYSKETMKTISELSPYRNYSVVVRVINHKGLGPISKQIVCSTRSAAPSKIEKVRVISTDDNCINVSWTPPKKINGPYLKYEIRVEPKGPSKNVSSTLSGLLYEKDYLCDLSPRQVYNVSVSAFHTDFSERTFAYNVSTKHGQMRIISIGRRIVVPDRTDVVLDCESVSETFQFKWLFNNSAFTIQKLYPNQSILLTNVSQKNSGIYTCVRDEDQISYELIVEYVKFAVPSAPEFYYHSVSPNSVLVSWRSDGYPRREDPIQKFNLFWDYDKQVELDESKRSYNITGLICGSNYTVSISAKNNEGSSLTSTVNVTTAGSTPRFADSSKLVSNSYPNAICFYLDAFLPGDGCPSSSFAIVVWSSSEGQVRPKNGYVFTKNLTRQELTNQCVNISKLNPDTSYMYEVFAWNNAGTTYTRGSAKTVHGISNGSTLTVAPIAPTSQFYYWVLYLVVAVIILIVVGLGILLFVLRGRRGNSRRNNTNPLIKNNFNNANNKLIPAPAVRSPVMSSNSRSLLPPSVRDRQLPSLPTESNHYDRGNSLNQDEDDDLKPYATYQPNIQIVPDGKRADPINYNISQTNSYQYPNVDSTLPLPTTVRPHPHAIPHQYHHPHPQMPIKQTFPQRSTYHKGYNTPATSKAANAFLNIDAESNYRPSSSTTESSTKEELSNIMRVRTQFPSIHHGELDRDSGTRLEQNTLTSHTLPRMDDRYFESGSSGISAGILQFTQNPPTSVAVPRPSQTTRPPRVQSQLSSGTYESVDADMPRWNPMPNPSNQIAITEIDNEEDESSNYTNNFVVV